MASQSSNGKRAPSVVVLAGPNGSGKSTVAPDLLQGALAVTEFVNADIIAQGLSGFRRKERRWKPAKSCSGACANLPGVERTSPSRPPWPAGRSPPGSDGFAEAATLSTWRSCGYPVPTLPPGAWPSGCTPAGTTFRRMSSGDGTGPAFTTSSLCIRNSASTGVSSTTPVRRVQGWWRKGPVWTLAKSVIPALGP